MQLVEKVLLTLAESRLIMPLVTNSRCRQKHHLKEARPTSLTYVRLRCYADSFSKMIVLMVRTVVETDL